MLIDKTMEYHCLICYEVCDPVEANTYLKSENLKTFCDIYNFDPNLIQEIQYSSGVYCCPACIKVHLQRARRILESLRIFQKQLENVRGDLDRNLRENSINCSKYIYLNALRKKIIDQIDLNASGGNNKSGKNLLEADEGVKSPSPVRVSVKKSPPPPPDELDGLVRRLKSLNPVPKPVETPQKPGDCQVPKKKEPNKLNYPSGSLELEGPFKEILIKPLISEESVLTEEELEETDPFQGISEESDEQIEEPPEAVKLLSPEEIERLRSECLSKSNRLILCLERLSRSELVQYSYKIEDNMRKCPNLCDCVRTHKEKGKPMCTVCGKKFNYKDLLSAHVKSVHGPKKKCPICSKLLSRSKIKEHISAHDKSSPKFLCPHCGISIKRERHLVKHIKNQHPPEDSISEPIPCPHEGCGKFFKASFNLKLHFKRMHERDSLPWVCDLCSKKFISTSTLEIHKNSHMIKPRPKPYKCDTCGGNYANPYELKRHVNQVHLKTYNHFCETCGKGFWSLRFLKTHQNLHTKSFQCSFCPKMFGSVSYVRIHEYSHSEEKDSQCETCGKSFKGPFALNKHIYRTHTRRKSKDEN